MTTWLRNGEELDRSGEVRDVNGSLVFRSVQRVQAGGYTCRATNEQGVISININVDIVGKNTHREHIIVQ